MTAPQPAAAGDQKAAGKGADQPRISGGTWHDAAKALEEHVSYNPELLRPQVFVRTTTAVCSRDSGSLPKCHLEYLKNRNKFQTIDEVFWYCTVIN